MKSEPQRGGFQGRSSLVSPGLMSKADGDFSNRVLSSTSERQQGATVTASIVSAVS